MARSGGNPSVGTLVRLSEHHRLTCGHCAFFIPRERIEDHMYGVCVCNPGREPYRSGDDIACRFYEYNSEQGDEKVIDVVKEEDDGD